MEKSKISKVLILIIKIKMDTLVQCYYYKWENQYLNNYNMILCLKTIMTKLFSKCLLIKIKFHHNGHIWIKNGKIMMEKHRL